MLGQHVRHPAPERIVDPTGAAGRDGDIEALVGPLAEGPLWRARRGSARRGQRHALS